MKTTFTKKIFSCVPVGKAFILLLCGMFSTSILNAQNCSGNKVWACRLDECGVQECKCIVANHVQEWMAQVPQCNWWHPNCCDGWRLSQDGIDAGSLNVYPNPVTPDMSGTTISFSLEYAQSVLLTVFDVSGRVVSVLVNSEFGQGNHEIKWNADVNTGIYFLQFQSEENSKMLKLSVTK